MSKNSLLGMDLLEWNALAGLKDPYRLELAKISADAGVPKTSQLSESSESDRDLNRGKGGRLGDIKRRHRMKRLRSGNNPMAAKDASPSLKKLLRNQNESGEYIVYPYDVYLEAFLTDSDSSLFEFNMLLDYAIEHDDADLQQDLLAIEEQLDEALGADLVKKAKAVGGAVKSGAKKAGGAVRDAAVNLAGHAKAGYQSGMAAAQAGKAASPAAPAPTTTPAPTAAAPAPAANSAPTSPAPAAGASPASPVTQGAGTGKPAQPGQTTKPKAKKQPGALAQLARGIGKVAKGVTGMPGGAVRSAAKAAGTVVGGVKKGYKGEDVEQWEEFLGESGLTADEYIGVIEHAYSVGDEEMIESAHQLDEIFSAWKKKKAAAASAKRDTVSAKWDKARAVQAKYGVDTTKKASVRGVDVQRVAKPKKAVNESIKKQLQLAGYTDEYIDSLKEG